LYGQQQRQLKKGIEAPMLTIRVNEEDLRLALSEPQKWGMVCPNCNERTQLKSFLDTGKYKDVDFTELYCPNDDKQQMLLKRI
jgi:hypothetical protein